MARGRSEMGQHKRWIAGRVVHVDAAVRGWVVCEMGGAGFWIDRSAADSKSQMKKERARAKASATTEPEHRSSRSCVAELGNA